MIQNCCDKSDNKINKYIYLKKKLVKAIQL